MFRYLIAIICGAWSVLLFHQHSHAIYKEPLSTTIISDDYEIRAQLRPRLQTILAAPLSARIVSLDVEEGDYVRQGTRIARLECAEHRAGMSMGQARQESAQASFDAAQRLKALDSGSDLDIALAKAELSAAKAEISRHQAILNKCEIKAPFAGRISTRPAMPYQYITEGEPIVDLLCVDQLEVEMIVPSIWLTWLNSGDIFQFIVDASNEVATGHVHMIGARVDPVSQTLRVIGRLDSSAQNLLPGLSGTVRFSRQ